MAQAKRKRRNKHRGNAVGVVEARGRTSKPKPGETSSKGRGGAASRPLKPPTLQGSLIKALVGAAILFVFFRFLSSGTTTGGALAMCFVAVALYTPIMYLTDRWIYNRKLKQQGASAKPAGARR